MLTDDELRQQWLTSSLRLRGQTPVEQRVQTVLRRQELLDEWERRNPHCIADWLASCGGQGDELPLERGQAPARARVIDWDALLRDVE